MAVPGAQGDEDVGQDSSCGGLQPTSSDRAEARCRLKACPTRSRIQLLSGSVFNGAGAFGAKSRGPLH